MFATGQTGLGGLGAVHTRSGRPDVRPWTRQSSQRIWPDWTDWPDLRMAYWNLYGVDNRII